MATRSVILVVPRRWERVLIRAELLERGHDVVGLRGIGELLTFHAAAAGHAPIGVVLVDGRALPGSGHGLLSVVRARKPDVAFLLLAEHVATIPDGPWDAVLMRPISIGALAARIDEILSLAAPVGTSLATACAHEPPSRPDLPVSRPRRGRPRARGAARGPRHS